MKLLGTALVFLTMTGFALATGVTAPEIDMNTVVAAIALASGGLLIARSRRKR